jgi:hypothetical protein
MLAVRLPSSVQARRDGRRPRRRWSAAGAALCATLSVGAALAGCGHETSGVHALAPSRTYEPVGPDIQWKATAEERHGLSARDFAAPAPEDEGPGPLHWELPAGWTEQPPSPMREVNLLAGDPRAECYLTTLAGEAGGLESNVNRWRAQLSLAPLDAAQLSALPRVPWLDGEAVSLDFEGAWTGMSGEAPKQGWRLVGLMLVRPGQSRFLKLVGPADVIARELAAFRGLAESFHEEEPQGGEAVASSGNAEEGHGALSWQAPPGWRAGPEKPMREATWFAGEGDAVECYVTLLGGEAGGVLANINRWCTQLGAPPLTEADVARLQRVPMAGTEGVLVRLERGAQPGVVEAKELLEGVICMLDGRALFVKLAGPRAEVEAQHAALLAFCRSMKVAT